MGTDFRHHRLIRTFDNCEHILYNASAELISVLGETEIFKRLFAEVGDHSDRMFKALSHTRSEAERTQAALGLMKDLWAGQMEAAPFILPNILADLEYARTFYPRYRDHTVHQLRVLLLGLYFYSKNSLLQGKLRERLKTLFPRLTTDADFDRCFAKTWTLISLYHDQGYVFEAFPPGETAKELSSILSELNHFFAAPISRYFEQSFGLPVSRSRERRARAGLRLPQPFFADSFDDLLYDPDGQTTILARIEPLAAPANLAGHSKGLENYFELARQEAPTEPKRPPFLDHGVCSAVLLLRSHEELSRYMEEFATAEEESQLEPFISSQDVRELIALVADDLAIFRPLVNEAAVAIALHNVYPKAWPRDLSSSARYDLTLENFKISLESLPFAFLLALVDTLQDWDRPRFSLQDDAADYITIDQDMLISCDGDSVRLSFSKEDSQKRAKVLEILNSYLDPGDVAKLVKGEASVTLPEVLMVGSIEDAVVEARRRRQERYELVHEQWARYRSFVDGLASQGYAEAARRTKRIRHFRNLLEWCEAEQYDLTTTAPDDRIEEIFSFMRLELKDLNEVVVGSLLDGRQVLSRIGAGGYGSVFKVAAENDGGVTEALKIFHTANFNESILVERFKRGFKSMSTLDHPQITKVHDFSLVPMGYFMEYIDGDDLGRFIENRETRRSLSSLEDRLSLFREVCLIIGAAHEEGVLHRDIKPENIIIRWSMEKGRFEPVLTDFDLAWFMQARAVTVSRQEIVGSYLYASPEQKKLQSRQDAEIVRRPTVDIYSLGRLLYFVLLEQPPDDDRDLSRVLREEVSHRYKPDLKSVPYWLAHIYERATKVRPEDRFSEVPQLVAALEQAMALIGAATGELVPEVMLSEITLRLNHGVEGELVSDVSKENAVTVMFPTGGIRVAWNQRGKMPYFEVRLSMASAEGMSLMEAKSYKDARIKMNRRMESLLEQSRLRYGHVQPGTSGELFSFSFRILEDRWTTIELARLCDLLGDMKVH